MNTRSIRNGNRFWHVDLQGPLVAIGDMITSEVTWSPKIQEQAVKFCKIKIEYAKKNVQVKLVTQ